MLALCHILAIKPWGDHSYDPSIGRLGTVISEAHTCHSCNTYNILITYYTSHEKKLQT